MTASNAVPREMRVSDWKPMEKGTLRAFFTIEMPSGLILHDCMLHEKGSARWIGLPARQYQKSSGATAWAPVVEFRDRQTADRFRDQCLRALESAGYSQ